MMRKFTPRGPESLYCQVIEVLLQPCWLAVDVSDDDADRLFHSRVLRSTNSGVDVSDGRDSADALSLPKYVVLIMGKHCATSRHHFIGSPEFTPHGFARDQQQQNAGAHNTRFHWIAVPRSRRK